MRAAFSNLQNINRARRDPEGVRAELERARVHLRWCCKLYRKHVERNAYLLHDHPAYATSWKTPEVIEVLAMSGVSRIVADQCRLGQQTDSGEPLKKPPGFM